MLPLFRATRKDPAGVAQCVLSSPGLWLLGGVAGSVCAAAVVTNSVADADEADAADAVRRLAWMSVLALPIAAVLLVMLSSLVMIAGGALILLVSLTVCGRCPSDESPIFRALVATGNAALGLTATLVMMAAVGWTYAVPFVLFLLVSCSSNCALALTILIGWNSALALGGVVAGVSVCRARSASSPCAELCEGLRYRWSTEALQATYAKEWDDDDNATSIMTTRQGTRRVEVDPVLGEAAAKVGKRWVVDLLCSCSRLSGEEGEGAALL